MDTTPPGLSPTETTAPSMAETAPQDGLVSPSTRGLKPSILIAQTALYGVYTLVPGYLIPVQVQHITGTTDVGSLGFALTLGGVAAALGNPLIGMLSDRTRSRFGRRTPWIVATGIVGAILLAVMANAATIVLTGLAYSMTWIALNGLQAALAAVVPDRVPQPQLNTYSGYMGVGLNAGVLLPSGLLILWPGLASQTTYYFLALIIAVAAVTFVFLSPDRSSLALERQRFTRRDLVSILWVNPRKAPDFAIAFGARTLLMLGYWLVFSLFFYLIQDYVGLSATAAVPAMAKIFFLNGVAALVGAWASAAVGRRLTKIKPTVVFSGLLLALSSAIPLLAPTMTGMYLWAIVNGLGFGIYLSVDTALAIRVLPDKTTAAKDLGILNLAMTIPIVLSPGLGAVLVTWFGYAGLLAAAAVVAVGGALAVLWIKSVD